MWEIPTYGSERALGRWFLSLLPVSDSHKIIDCTVWKFEKPNIKFGLSLLFLYSSACSANSPLWGKHTSLPNTKYTSHLWFAISFNMPHLI